MTHHDAVNTLTLVVNEVVNNDWLLLKLVSELPPDLQKEYLPKVQASIEQTNNLLNKLP